MLEISGVGTTGKDKGIYMVKDFNPKLRDRIVTTAMIIEVRINLRRSSFTCSAIDIWVEVIGLSDLVMIVSI